MGIEATVTRAQAQKSDPGGRPANCLFVPSTVRFQVLQWGHSSHLTCHPGAAQTLDFLLRKFWWPTIKEDTQAFVAACPTCNQGKVPHQTPQGLLHPLPTPQQPWSHL